MNLKFLSLDIHNFFSIGSSELNLDKRGVTSIVGRNLCDSKSISNGSGKSSINEAIIWCLTGTTPRGVSGDSVINRYKKSEGTLVALTVMKSDVEYVITRTRKHQKYGDSLSITKNGIDISGATMTKSEAVLSTELELNPNTINSILILSADMPGKFTSLSPTNRKSRLEELAGKKSIVTDLKGK